MRKRFLLAGHFPVARTGLDCSLYGIYIWSVTGLFVRGSKSSAEAALAGEKRDVTKKEIVRTISEEIGLTQLKTKEIVQKTFDAIVDTLVTDGRIELRNFGVFEVKRRAPRKARNPRTGERVDVGEKYVVTFKPGKEMEQRVHELERKAAARAASEAAMLHTKPDVVPEPAVVSSDLQTNETSTVHAERPLP